MVIKTQINNRNLYKLWIWFHILAFLGINLFVQKTFFYYWPDSFLNQMNEVAIRILNWDAPDLFDPFIAPPGFLGIVHLLRFVVVFPFYLSWLAQYPAVFDSFFLLIFLLPVLLARFGARPRNWYQPFLIYLPYFFSFRAVLTMCSIAYLFIYFYSRRNEFLMLVSLFLANLSSGVVLLWLAIVFVHMKRIHPKALYAVLSMFFVMSISFASAVVEKISFFLIKITGRTKEDTPISREGGEASLLDIFETIFSRNTLVYSLADGDWPRFIFYTGLLISLIILIWYTGRITAIPSEMRWFFVASLPLFLVEGLGAVSILICILLFFVNYFNPSWRQKLESRLIFASNK